MPGPGRDGGERASERASARSRDVTTQRGRERERFAGELEGDREGEGGGGSGEGDVGSFYSLQEGMALFLTGPEAAFCGSALMSSALQREREGFRQRWGPVF